MAANHVVVQLLQKNYSAKMNSCQLNLIQFGYICTETAVIHESSYLLVSALQQIFFQACFDAFFMVLFHSWN